MKYDVMTITRGEWTLPYAISSVHKVIPINNLIIGATSDCLERIKNFATIIFPFDESNIGKARAEAMKYVETPVFINVDSDVQVTPEWFEWCSKTIQEPKVAACHGFERTMGKYDPKVKERIYRSRGKGPVGFGSTFLKTSVIKKVGIPTDGGDDDVKLMHRISDAGYEWVSNINVVCHHIKNDVDCWKSYARFASWERRLKASSKADRIERVLLRIPYSLTAGMRKRPFMENMYIVGVQVSLLYGKFLGTFA